MLLFRTSQLASSELKILEMYSALITSSVLGDTLFIKLLTTVFKLSGAHCSDSHKAYPRNRMELATENGILLCWF